MRLKRSSMLAISGLVLGTDAHANGGAAGTISGLVTASGLTISESTADWVKFDVTADGRTYHATLRCSGASKVCAIMVGSTKVGTATGKLQTSRGGEVNGVSFALSWTCQDVNVHCWRNLTGATWTPGETILADVKDSWG